MVQAILYMMYSWWDGCKNIIRKQRTNII